MSCSNLQLSSIMLQLSGLPMIFFIYLFVVFFVCKLVVVFYLSDKFNIKLMSITKLTTTGTMFFLILFRIFKLVILTFWKKECNSKNWKFSELSRNNWPKSLIYLREIPLKCKSKDRNEIVVVSSRNDFAFNGNLEGTQICP